MGLGPGMRHAPGCLTRRLPMKVLLAVLQLGLVSQVPAPASGEKPTLKRPSP